MNSLAVYYNNAGVDILLGRNCDKNICIGGVPVFFQDDCCATSTEINYLLSNMDCRSNGTCSSSSIWKRHKSNQYHHRYQSNNRERVFPAKEEVEFSRHQRVDEALQCFHKALFLMKHRQSTLQQPSSTGDRDGFTRFQNHEIEQKLIQCIEPIDTGIELKGSSWENTGASTSNSSSCPNEYIHWKVIRIKESRHSNIFAQSSDHANSKCMSMLYTMISMYNIALCYQYKGITTKKREMEMYTIRMRKRMHELDGYSSMIPSKRIKSFRYQDPHGRRHSTKTETRNRLSISYPSFPSMSSPPPKLSNNTSNNDFFFGVHHKAPSTYQMFSSSESTKTSSSSDSFAGGPNIYVGDGSSSSNTSSFYYLKSAVDYYSQAHDFMIEFRRVPDMQLYTLLMATTNNLASTYFLWNQPECERDRHLGQEMLSLSEDRAVLRREEDRATFESFLGNVMYLLTGYCNRNNNNEDELSPPSGRHYGDFAAAAA